MTKYTRSIQKLTTNIDNVFAVEELSLDTKAIILFLAATMPCNEFYQFIDPIKQLDVINVICKEINVLRLQFGLMFRDLIILTVLKRVNFDVSSDELQQYINSSQEVEHMSPLSPALSTENMFIKNSMREKAILHAYSKRNVNSW